MREAMAGGSELPVVRAAGIFAAAACWARSGAPLDVAAITLVWAMVSARAPRKSACARRTVVRPS